jgi:predicted ATPase
LNSAANNFIAQRIGNNGGINDYLWRGSYKFPLAEIGVYLNLEEVRQDTVLYELKFTRVNQNFQIIEELINPVEPVSNDDFYYRNKNNHSVLMHRRKTSEFEETLKAKPSFLQQSESQQSILGRLDNTLTGYNAIRKIENYFGNIKIYEDWRFTRSQSPRSPIGLNNRTSFLSENGENLALIIDGFRHNSYVYEKVIENLRKVYSRVEKLKTIEQGSDIQLYIQEQGIEELISAYRLSNGTLRYLCLLAILCHPEPPPLICIEEPETGLHPDILPTIAELMIEASQKTQLIVTTHSDILVSAFSEIPEAVLVCEKDEDGTHFTRLKKDELKAWLEEYELGDLWLKGEIGGKRW